MKKLLANMVETAGQFAIPDPSTGREQAKNRDATGIHDNT